MPGRTGLKIDGKAHHKQKDAKRLSWRSLRDGCCEGIGAIMFFDFLCCFLLGVYCSWVSIILIAIIIILVNACCVFYLLLLWAFSLVFFIQMIWAIGLLRRLAVVWLYIVDLNVFFDIDSIKIRWKYYCKTSRYLNWLQRFSHQHKHDCC